MDIEIADDVAFPDPRPGEQWVVGALITDRHGRVFVQRRSNARRLFPGCWDIVGGHVEPGESLVTALAREVAEETGWSLDRIDAVAGQFDWQDVDGGWRREFDVVATVRGDLGSPQLEWSKHSEYRWIGPEDIDVLEQGRDPDDTAIHELVASHFA